MSRSVPKWVGATDDAMPPPRVRLRIFDRCGGRCHRSGRAIGPGDTWALDHILALCNGGANDEDNLAPILSDEHPAKTAEDVALKAKIARVRKSHLGIKSRKAIIPGSKASKWKKRISGEVVRRDG